MLSALSAREVLFSCMSDPSLCQLTRVLMCLGVWSLMGYVHDNNVKAAAVVPEIDEEDDLLIDWDMIH